jgi:hypothetical protein
MKYTVAITAAVTVALASLEYRDQYVVLIYRYKKSVNVKIIIATHILKVSETSNVY